MQESDELRIDLRQSAKVDNLRHEMTWASSIRGLARRFKAVMFRLMLVSPRMEKQRA